MPVMERRLQLLLDQERFDRVRREAESSGRSVAAVIREAIDVRFPSRDEERAAAMRRFLEMTAEGSGKSESWAEIKAEMEAEEIAHMDRVLGQ